MHSVYVAGIVVASPVDFNCTTTPRWVVGYFEFVAWGAMLHKNSK